MFIKLANVYCVHYEKYPYIIIFQLPVAKKINMSSCSTDNIDMRVKNIYVNTHNWYYGEAGAASIAAMGA